MMLNPAIDRPSLFQKTLRPIFWAGGLVLAVFILAAPISLPNPAPIARYFYIEASSFSYSPEMIRVEPGDRVTIELMATDVIHGIYIDGYNLEASADPGQIARLSFVADRPGLFRFRCAVPCGAMHPFMIGKLQVGPNLLLVRAVLLIILLTFLLVLWLRKQQIVTT